MFRSPRSSNQAGGIRPRLLVAVAVLAACAGGVLFWMSRTRTDLPPAVAPPGGVAGKYADLAPQQRRLVDDWTSRFNSIMSKSITPVELYDDMILSSKTTFNAVTHALQRTTLTDKAGKPMNMTALDLVERVETVAGSVPGKGGDKQFRIYVEVRPDTQAVLEKCREFRRGPDNTVFHKGYPTCFRGAGSVPNIQFSLARSGKRADIDVDYRSSSFPIMLVNGHLTASNSDVRAGDNDQRHNNRWSGLANWWRGFLGFPVFEAPRAELAAARGPVSNAPRLGKDAKPEEAIHDFLNAWLVERKPGVAAGYISPRAFACLELERGVKVDRGLARFQFFQAMETVNGIVGKPAKLSDAIGGVVLHGPRGELMRHVHEAEFAMYDVREDLAEQMDCDNRLSPELADPKKARSTEFGEYVGAVFQLKAQSVKGESVATVWAKDKSGWTLVSYDRDPQVKPEMPAAPLVESQALPVVAGDPAMIRAAAEFHDAWYLRKDGEAAFKHLSPRCYPCYNVFRPDEQPQAASVEEAGKLIGERMKLLGDWAGEGSRLEDLLVAVEPHHHDLKIVKHDRPAAFVIVALPGSMASQLDCSKLRRGESPPVENASGAKSYGSHFATGFRLKRSGPDAAILWALWGREAGAWKVTSYAVMTP